MKKSLKKKNDLSFCIKSNFEVKKNSKGDVYKILNKDSDIYKGFGELYMTTLNKKVSKGWI